VPRNDPVATGRPAVRWLQVDDLAVEITIRRVRRMNLGVHPPDGRVSVSVTSRTSDRAVARFVRESRSWIDRHRERIRSEERAAALRPLPPSRVGAAGEVWFRFERPLRLDVVTASGRPRVGVPDEGRLEVRIADPSDRDAVLRAIERWQRSELRAAAEPMLARWCERVGVRYEFLGLRRMSTRWGSCVPAQGRIWLSLALFERGTDLLEYVVVHEVVHLREASHGPRFRSLMDAHLPDWRERRQRLDTGTVPILSGHGVETGGVPGRGGPAAGSPQGRLLLPDVLPPH
jgi:predicted metal-dependent hydrolase